MGTIFNKIKLYCLHIFPYVVLSINLINYGCLSGKGPSATNQNRYSQETTVTPPEATTFSFIQLESLTTIEGFPVTSNALDCTSTSSSNKSKYSIVEQDPSNLNCKIVGTKAPYIISCGPPIATGHEIIEGTLNISCTIDGTTVYQTAQITVNDLNFPPQLDAVSDQYLFVRNAIATVNAGVDNLDLDVDLDPLSYSCSFTSTSQIEPIDCDQLPGTVSFSTSTGILDWTPTQASTYLLSILASDGQEVPLFDTTEFTIIVDSVENPAFTSITPASPSIVSLAPIIKGTLSENAATIDFFDNSGCLNAKIGTGRNEDYSETGITINVPANSTTNIYAKAYDANNNSSECTLLTTYVHDNISPTSSSFGFTTPASPTNSTTSILIAGSSSTDTSSISFYSDSTCVNTSIGRGTKSEFDSTGISITVNSNATTTIYARSQDLAGNLSLCTLLANFIHDNLAPGDPSFSSITPTSPSKTSSTPTIFGSLAGSDINAVKIYSNSACTTLLSSGTLIEFTSTGISVSLSSNSTTSLYAKAFDLAGNYSNCILLTSYTHDSNSPNPPSFASTSSSSPSTDTAPEIIGSADIDVENINFYNDVNCNNLIGTGTRSLYITTGISLSVTANALTSLYAKSVDLAQNSSACTLLTTYLHDNIAPTSIATLSDKTYFNSTTSTPTITWSASSDSGSGISDYKISIGTTSGGTDILSWTSLGVVTTTSVSGLSLTNGTIYYTNIKAIDLVGLESTITTSDGWSVDTSIPSTPVVTANSCSSTNFLGSWTAATDAQSGIDYYQYSLGVTTGDTSIVSWTNVNSDTLNIDRDSLSLDVGTSYYINIRAINQASGTSASTSSSVECMDLNQSLKAFWSMNEASGTRLDSVAVNNLDDNNSVLSAAGKISNAASFVAASSQFLSISSNADLSINDDSLTLSLWVYVTDNSVDGSFVYKWNGSTDEYALDYLSTGNIRFRVGTGSVTKLQTLTNNTWYHILAYHDKDNDELAIIVNDGAATTSSYALGTTSGSSDFVLGANTSLGVFLNARIDSVGVWKRTLTSNEISYLYNSGNGYEE